MVEGLHQFFRQTYNFTLLLEASCQWNGFGGKLEPGETVLVGAARELQEETGLIVNTEDLQSVGRIEYEHRLEHGEVLSLQVHIFQTRNKTLTLMLPL